LRSGFPGFFVMLIVAVLNWLAK